MQIFNSGFFWFIEGILFCLVIYGFNLWTKDKGIFMTWWKWLSFVLWIFFFYLIDWKINFINHR